MQSHSAENKKRKTKKAPTYSCFDLYQCMLSLSSTRKFCTDLTDAFLTDDRIEKARMVWEWWKTYHHKVRYFSSAARLVALVQTSSASVERAFDQLKVVVDTVGVNALEESNQTHVMSRINEY